MVGGGLLLEDAVDLHHEAAVGPVLVLELFVDIDHERVVFLVVIVVFVVVVVVAVVLIIDGQAAIFVVVLLIIDEAVVIVVVLVIVAIVVVIVVEEQVGQARRLVVELIGTQGLVPYTHGLESLVALHRDRAISNSIEQHEHTTRVAREWHVQRR